MLRGYGAAGVLAHAGELTGPHDLLGAWNPDPLLLTMLVATTVVVARGHRAGPRHRQRLAAYAGGLLALVVALVSPLDALAGQLASAHMVQHLLLVQVAAPLLAWCAPSAAVVRGVPGGVRRATRGALRRVGLGPRRLRRLWSPVGWLLLHTAALWLWHSAWLYDAAVADPSLHLVEHLSFLVTGYLLWSSVVGAARHRVSPGVGILALFLVTLQGVMLSALLTFAREPWYASYRTTTAVWGLDPLADQQLAGVVMWIPGGVVNVAVALGLAVQWLHRLDDPGPAGVPRPGPPPELTSRSGESTRWAGG